MAVAQACPCLSHTRDRTRESGHAAAAVSSTLPCVSSSPSSSSFPSATSPLFQALLYTSPSSLFPFLARKRERALPLPSADLRCRRRQPPEKTTMRPHARAPESSHERTATRISSADAAVDHSVLWCYLSTAVSSSGEQHFKNHFNQSLTGSEQPTSSSAFCSARYRDAVAAVSFSPLPTRRRRFYFAAGVLTAPDCPACTSRIASTSSTFSLLGSTAAAPPIVDADAVFATVPCPADPACEREGKQKKRNREGIDC
uniref:Uncharacterized protein n=1 Tax=Leersia perrieri TaxID=77586 RepID=A0A0D9VW34_9ORYZ